MAKAALLDVLQQTIGKYVKNLDPESLNVAVWSGKIELNSLELDVESINSLLDKQAEEAPNFAMPFKILSGRFESFQVDVPWSAIASRPVVLRARGLSVMVEPLDRSASQLDDDDDDGALDDEAVKQIKRAAKQKELRDQKIDENNNYRKQAYALKMIALGVHDDNTTDGIEGDKTTFTSRLVRKIMENIQVEISDVHVSLRSTDGSAGVVLKSLKLMTTDKEGEKVYVDRTAAPRRNSSLADVDMSFLYKMFQIEGLGIYLDEDEFENARKSLGAVSEDRVSNASDRSSGSLSSLSSLGHSYVLAPLSFETKLRIADSKCCADNSKYQMRSGLSSLSFLLTRNQMDIARKVANIMSPSNLGPTPLFPEYRPLVSVKGNAKEWWKYSVRCIGRMSGRRSWIEFLHGYQIRKKYIPLFKRQAHYRECSWVKPLSSHEIDELMTIEHDRSISVEGLMIWRNIADAQIDKEKSKLKSEEKETTTTSTSSSMYSYIFGSSTVKPSEDEVKQVEEQPAIVLTVEEMRALEEISELDITDKDLSKDSILYDMEFVLDSLKLDLVGYDLNHVASLDMGKVSIDFDATVDGAFTSSFELYDLEIFDRTTPNSLFPSVLKMIDRVPETNKSRALHLHLSKSSSGDQSLVLKMAEFQLVASKFMARELQQFFQDNSSERPSLSKMKANPMLRKSVSGSVDLFYDANLGESIRQLPVAPENVDDIRANNSPVVKEILSNKLIDVWKKKSKSKASWMLDLDVRAPVVLIPDMCNDPQANVLVFDLGNLKINYGKGDPSAPVQKWFDENPRESLADKVFEVGTIDVNHLTFSVQKAMPLQSADSVETKEPAIIDPIGVVIEFAIEDIGPNFKPRSCFLGVIPTISLELSPVQGSQILEVINSWTYMFITSSDDETARDASKSSSRLE